MTQQREGAARRLGLSINESSDDVTFSSKSLISGMGGSLGIVESIAPGFVFLTIWSFSKNAAAAAIAASATAFSFIAYRLLTRKTATQALAGAAGVVITAFMVLRDGGQAADYFVPGFFTNAAYATVLLLSVLIRWPIIGVLVGALTGNLSGWRRTPIKMRIFTFATLLWVAMFALRLFVQLPLYFTSQIEALGVARLVMGLPLYAMTIWLTWLMVRRVVTDKNNW